MPSFWSNLKKKAIDVDPRDIDQYADSWVLADKEPIDSAPSEAETAKSSAFEKMLLDKYGLEDLAEFEQQLVDPRYKEMVADSGLSNADLARMAPGKYHVPEEVSVQEPEEIPTGDPSGVLRFDGDFERQKDGSLKLVKRNMWREMRRD